MALGVDMVAAVAGSFLGLLIGGVLSEWDWRAIFWVGVPIGILAPSGVCAAQGLGVRTLGAGLAGCLTFGIALTVLLDRDHLRHTALRRFDHGWTNPWGVG